MTTHDLDRFSDLQKQGFMRAVYAKPKLQPKKKVIVSCNACKNWHTEGKHTADVVTRRANTKERKAWLKTLSPEQRQRIEATK